MKQIILLAAFVFSAIIPAYCLADELPDFNAIKAVISAGKNIHFIIDYAKCASSNNTLAQTIGIRVYGPNPIAITVDNRIGISLKHFTLNHPGFPGKAVYEFIRYGVMDDNHVNVAYQVLDAVNYAPLSDKTTFDCQIGTGAKFYD